MSIAQASFICAPTEASPIFMKKIAVKNPCQSEIEISGLGFFELYINGKKVSDDVLVPPTSDYGKRDLSTLYYPIKDTFSHRVYYCRYALSEYLICGENTVEIQLGGGYYCQEVRTGEGKLSYGKPILALSLTVDGKEYLSDASWVWRDSVIVSNNLYTGEVQDFRHRDDEWKSVTLAKAPSGKLCESDCPHDKIIRKIRPAIVFSDGERTVYDAGVNLSGVVGFRQRANKGEQTEIRYAELLDGSSHLWTVSAGPIVQRDIYISNGELNFCMPKFVFHGFRYFEIIGKAEDVLVYEIHSNIPLRVKFFSDHPVLNFLFTASVRSLYSNMHAGIITDCPHRERLGYTGDGQLTADLGLTVLSSEKFYEKWLRDIADGQDPETGHVQHTAPFQGGGGGPGGWGGAIVIVPYMLWLHHNREDLLRTYYPNMKKYIAYMESRSENGLVVREEERGWCLGDWCTPEKIVIPEPFVNTYFLVKCLQYVAQTAHVLGDSPKSWLKKAEERKQALRKHYYDEETNTYCADVQGANAFALDIGIGNETMMHTLVEKYEALGEFDTGIFGTDILIRVLFENGFGNTAMKLLTSEKGSSFGTWMKRGETTLCEYWDERKSHNHHMFGAPLRYVFSHILGVKDDGTTPLIAPEMLTFPIKLETYMSTKFGNVFVRREITEKDETITVRADHCTLFRYRNTEIALIPNEESVFYFVR
ncbi:MAG: family 78 glycoside hydrolase catalytic domain [Clostridia bacterium]|nr:family 78 glycoside hydrolase catalytic domain [Clostridia bacterium]